MNKQLVIIEYGLGNLASITNALDALSIPFQISSDPKIIKKASGLILPGVGAAGVGMKNLKRNGLDKVIREEIIKGKPILGICLGMQLLFSFSEEGNVECLDVIKGRVKKLKTSLKIPQIGWNNVRIKNQEARIMKNISNSSFFYFVNSYICFPNDQKVIAGVTDYDGEFCSVFVKDNIIGVQFHPEKSGEVGLRILKNFYSLVLGRSIMTVIPAIDIKDGKCVRLTRGKFDQEIIYDDDPIRIAKQWEKEGAAMLHIVDLDGAKKGRQQNFEIIKKIVQSVNIPVQVGGGIRNKETVKKLLAVGVASVVLGTIALENEKELKRILADFGQQTVVALETIKGRLMKNGWIEESDKMILDTALALQKIGVKKFLFTDISRDGTLTEPNYKEIKRLKKIVGVPIIASGGISSNDAVKKLIELGVDQVIIGKALYEKEVYAEGGIICWLNE